MRLALYAGGFLGPFGGGVLAVLIPQVRDAFATTTAAATAGITAYLVPFAALQLVSGTLGERWGLGRTVRTAYVAYALVSAAVAFAPDVASFLAGRAVQGAANAFLSPLLLAALAAGSPEGSVGRTVGTFVAVQTTGIVASPLIGGLLGEVDWRLAFLVPAVAALALAALPLPGTRRAAGEAPPRLRAALTRRVARLSLAACVAYLSIAGIGFLVALRAADELGAGSTARGLLLAAFGAAGVVAGQPAGRLGDAWGRTRTIALGAVVCAATVPLLGVVDSLALLALVWALAGVGSALLWAALTSLAVEAAPANRAGATSIFSAFRFAGTALAPVLWLPLYETATVLPFAAAGASCLALGVLAARLG